MNIVLIGYRCCGKTSVGKNIAERLDKRFIDTDDLIRERSASSIDNIVSRHGWQHFRELEKDVIKEVTSNDDLVIAAGGGVVTEKENIQNLKKNGFFIWLRSDIETIKERMKKDEKSSENRPSLTGEDPVDEIKRVMEVRKPLYESAADMIIDTSSISIPEVAELILSEVKRENSK
jgi:shikimate kinase